MAERKKKILFMRESQKKKAGNQHAEMIRSLIGI